MLPDFPAKSKFTDLAPASPFKTSNFPCTEMSLVSPKLDYVTSPSRKQEAREAAHRLRYGSPKLRDLLRERCRVRVKERREAGFCRGRKLIDTNADEGLKRLIREEFERDIELQELIYAEMMSELGRWVEEEMEYMQGLKDEMVVCPACQMAGLVQSTPLVMKCPCGSHFEGQLEDFHRDLQKTLEVHKCPSSVGFFREAPKVFSAVCMDCDFFATLPYWKRDLLNDDELIT